MSMKTDEFKGVVEVCWSLCCKKWGEDQSLCSLVGIVNRCARPWWHSADEGCTACHRGLAHPFIFLPMSRGSGLVPPAFNRVINTPHSRPQHPLEFTYFHVHVRTFSSIVIIPHCYIYVFLSALLISHWWWLLDSVLKRLVFSKSETMLNQCWEGKENDACWNSGWKSRCAVPPTHC